MQRCCAVWLLLVCPAASATLIPDVRAAIAKGSLERGEQLIREYRAKNGVTSEMLEALSWLGRGALAGKQLDRAEVYAAETRKLALDLLKTSSLDDDRYLPIALGASIEVQSHVLAGRAQLSEAITFLQQELKTYWNTSIHARIQKNINLLSLEGKLAPPLNMKEWLGPKPPTEAQWKGRPVLMFFWAHWCGDCKNMAPVLAKLQSEFSNRGLLLIGPTQRYGYTARGQEAGPAEEFKYIGEIRDRFYSVVPEMHVPVSEEDFRAYGASTTPTLVLLDREGIVRLYHPGQMTYEQLAPKVAIIAEPVRSSATAGR